MELIELTGPGVEHGEVHTVRHSTTHLVRGLDFGEGVVTRTPDGEYHAAEVIELDFEPEDTIYVLRVGARLPPELAAERLADAHLDADTAGVHAVVDLLVQLQLRPGG